MQCKVLLREMGDNDKQLRSLFSPSEIWSLSPTTHMCYFNSTERFPHMLAPPIAIPKSRNVIAARKNQMEVASYKYIIKTKKNVREFEILHQILHVQRVEEENLLFISFRFVS